MWLNTYVIASAKEIDALNITLFSYINSTNVHLCNYCTKIFVIVVNTCVCRRSVDNKAVILSYPVHLLSLLRLLRYVCSALTIPFLRLQSFLATLATGVCYTCYPCYAFYACYNPLAVLATVHLLYLLF